MTTTTLPLCDRQAIIAAVNLIVPPGGVTELRALDANTDGRDWVGTYFGYFDDAEKLADAAMTIQRAMGIYIVLNPVNPALLARANNRLKKAGKGALTQDSNIEARRFLPIDVDSERPAGISATDEEVSRAADRAKEIHNHLRNVGWPEPLVARSGNGSHLLYRIDVPADDAGLVKKCLQALHQRFTRDGIIVDTSVFNPARIWKLYGTRACKGDDTPARPHRMAEVMKYPELLEVVPVELLEALDAEVKQEAPKPNHNGNGHAHTAGQSFDIEDFIASHGLEVDGPRDWGGNGRKWILRKSPMCEHHGDGPFIAEMASGAIVARCHHNSCNWEWKDLREALEPAAMRSRQEVSRDTVRTPHQPPGLVPPADLPPKPVTINGPNNFGEWRTLLEKGEPPRRFKTWSDDNLALQRINLAPEEVLLVGAPPGCGKTAAILQLVVDALLNDATAKALIANVEMPTRRMLDRMLSRLAQYSLTAIDNRDIDWGHPRIGGALERLEEVSARIHWLDAPYAMRHVAKEAADIGADIVVLDYIQRFDSGEADRRGNVDGAMGAARLLADGGAAVIVVSAIARGRDSKGRSTYAGQNGIATFRESSELEFGVDEAYVMCKDEETHTVTFHHCKARYRELQDFHAQFVGKFQLFEEPSRFEEWTSR